MTRPIPPVGLPPQDVRFCCSADGTRVAYAVHGSGPPLVLASCWLSHLEFDWQSPVWRHFLLDLGRFATVVRYDERGYGMSDREVADFGLDQRVADLEAVADAAGLGRFALLGMSQGGPVAVTYASRHPERVTRLVLYGTHGVAQRRKDPEALELEQTFQQMIKVGFGRAGQHVPPRVHQPHDPRSDRGAGRLVGRVAGQGDLGGQRRPRPRDPAEHRRPRPAAGAVDADAGPARPGRPHDRLCGGPGPGGPDPGRAAGGVGQHQPHHAQR